MSVIADLHDSVSAACEEIDRLRRENDRLCKLVDDRTPCMLHRVPDSSSPAVRCSTHLFDSTECELSQLFARRDATKARTAR